MRRQNGGINIGELKYYLKLKNYLQFHSVLLKAEKMTNKSKINSPVKYSRSGC